MIETLVLGLFVAAALVTVVGATLRTYYARNPQNIHVCPRCRSEVNHRATDAMTNRAECSSASCEWSREYEDLTKKHVSDGGSHV